MSRIGTLPSNNVLINHLFDVNRRLQNEQIQLSTEKVSQTYSGISAESQRLVTYENSFAALGQFIDNNDAVSTRLEIATSAVEAMRETVRDFESELQRFQASAVKDRAAADHLQNAAFRALANMSTYLNTEADGRFIFAGGRVDQVPVDFPYSSLAAFQAAFDGSTVTYPTTRSAHLEKFSLSKDGNSVTNWLTFRRDNGASPPVGRITSATAQFANVAVGSTITISGTANNNGTYTVKAVGGGGTTVDIVTEMLTDETSVPITVTYPNPNQVNATITLTTTATFNRQNGTITYNASDLAAIPAGSAITVAGSASNNSTYTVSSNSASVITIVQKKLTDEGASTVFQNTAGGTITFTDVGAAGTDTITLPAGTVAGLSPAPTAGTTFKITGTGATDGTYTVVSVAGDVITVAENIAATTNTTDNAATIVFGPSAYFQFAAAANTITFTNNVAPTKDTIASTVASAFSSLKAGMQIKLTGSSSTNGDNDTYTIDSVSSDGKTLTIKEDLPAATVTDATDVINFLVMTAPGTVAATPYYHGDVINLSHRPSTQREVDWDLTAIDPAFEKALRAMGLIAQGAFGSEGGLDQNISRVNQASYLVRSSLAVTVTGTPPFGTEEIGSIEAVEQRIGYKQVLLEETNDVHTAFRNFLQTGMNRIENIDRTEVMMNILDDTRTLEASYQALARIRELTLVNFL
jgi:flagellin-like hook-associated protein FlgL